MRDYLLEMFLVSLLLTIAVELAVAFVCFAIRGKNKILLVTLVNVLTNPPAVLLCWLGRRYLPDTADLSVQFLVEVAVIIVEAWIYCSFAKKSQWEIDHPIKLSVAANLCAWLFGVILLVIRRSL